MSWEATVFLATDLIRKLSVVWKGEEEIRHEKLHKNSCKD